MCPANQKPALALTHDMDTTAEISIAQDEPSKFNKWLPLNDAARPVQLSC